MPNCIWRQANYDYAMVALRITEVSKRYRGVLALDGVSIDVERGETFGLLGRNGAGKTTLVKIALNLVRASSGSVSIFDRPATRAQSRQPIGYLPEDHRFLDYQNGLAALEFYAQLSGVPRRVRRSKCEELLELVDLSKDRKKKVGGYSKGMKQRLGLAQTLVHDPEILFLDEPTDGVDPVGRHKVRTVLSRLRESGKTIFLNSHLLSEMEQIATRIGILDRGQLIRIGALEDLTRVRNIFIIRTEPTVDPTTLAAMESLGGDIRLLDDKLEVTVDDPATIDRLIDWLRARHIGIRKLQGKQRSLEEAFLDALSDNEEGTSE